MLLPHIRRDGMSMWNSLSDFYTSDEWSEFRRVLALERGSICEYCGEPIINKYDLIGHHIIPLTEENVNDYDVSLNPKNVMLVHHRCHNEIHERFGTFTRHIYLVYGSPCAGKRTWVNNNAGVNDIVVDMDSIYECISINDRYSKPATLSGSAFAVRDFLLDMIKVRRGKWHHAFIIGGYPRQAERERICKTFGAEEIFIDTDKATCLERSLERSGWDKYVERWFDEYIPTVA